MSGAAAAALGHLCHENSLCYTLEFGSKRGDVKPHNDLGHAARGVAIGRRAVASLPNMRD